MMDAGGDDGGERWWQREQAVPKPAPVAEDESSAAARATSRDDWMVSLPTGRSGLTADSGQARQFSRNGTAGGVLPSDLAMWTETPADRERKAAAKWGSADGGGGSSSSSQPMTLADAVAIASANAAAGKRPREMATSSGGEGSGSQPPAAKSLVDLNAERLAAEAKQGGKKQKADWEGQHPWRPWDREKDLDIRQVNPKGKESVLKDQIMGSLGDRFGNRGKRESTFM